MTSRLNASLCVANRSEYARYASRFAPCQPGDSPVSVLAPLYPRAVNAPETIRNLRLVGKSYGGGAIKVEPRNLERLAIPEALASRLAAGPPAGASRLPLR